MAQDRREPTADAQNTTSTGNGSTTKHRNVQRVSLVALAADAGAGKVNPVAEIPFQFAQAMMAFGSVIYCKKMKPYEKGIQITQGVLSSARLITNIIMLAEDETCANNDTSLCKAALILFLLYIGLLGLTATIAENTKEAYVAPEEAVHLSSVVTR